MTLEEAREWIDNWMSGGGSWSDAQSLMELVNKTSQDTIATCITRCESQLWGGVDSATAVANGEYRTGQWRGTNDCVMALKQMLKG